MEYELIRSNRKTVSIIIKNCRVIVRGPYSLTKEKADKFISEKIDWIEKNIKKQKDKGTNYNNLSDDKIKKMKNEAKDYFKNKLTYYSKIMNLNYSRMFITSAKTRFGSCNSKGNISFSYRLMLYPEEAREYVVVHELAHLIKMDHSKEFYKIIESILPDYKRRRQLLK